MGYRGYNIQVPEDRTWLTPSASGFANAPPETPEDGLRLIVGTEPTGAFADHENDIVDRTAGEWVFTTPDSGSAITVVVDSVATIWTFNGGGWSDDPISEINGVPIGQEIQAPGAFTTVVATAGVYSPVFYHRQTPNSTNGNIDALLASYTLTRFTGTSPVLRGILPPPVTVPPANWRGVHMFIRCDTSTGMTIAHQSDAVDSGRRIITPTGADMRLEQGEIAIIVLSTSGAPADWRWLVLTAPVSWIQTRGPRIVALTDGSEITVNPAIGDVFTVAIEDNRTIAISDGTVVGRLITLQVTQADGGGHAVTLAGNVEFSDVVADLSEVDTTNGAKARILLEWDGADWVVLGLVNSGGA
jgi:hypothetical protein